MREVCELLGMTENNVRRIKRTLGGIKGEHGRLRFDPLKVQQHKRRRDAGDGRPNGATLPPNASPAQIFKAISEGKSAVEIVMLFDLHPALVEQMVLAHARLRDAVVLSAEQLAELGRLPHMRTAQSAEELVTLLQRTVVPPGRCVVCKERAAELCHSCPSPRKAKAAAS